MRPIKLYRKDERALSRNFIAIDLPFLIINVVTHNIPASFFLSFVLLLSFGLPRNYINFRKDYEFKIGI